jgi:hypothetical protein
VVLRGAWGPKGGPPTRDGSRQTTHVTPGVGLQALQCLAEALPLRVSRRAVLEAAASGNRSPGRGQPPRAGAVSDVGALISPPTAVIREMP